MKHQEEKVDLAPPVHNMSNIFDALLVEKYRPKTFNDIVLDSKAREYFTNAIKEQTIPHLLFYGAPGTGKTTLAKILASELHATTLYCNASDERGIDAVRAKIIPFAQTKSIDGTLKVVILDEVDGFTPEAQRALRNTIEEYCDNVRFILTANYRNRISEPIRSRVIEFEFDPPIKDIKSRVVSILLNENIDVDEDQKQLLKDLIDKTYPDIRKTINLIQQNTKNGKLKIVTKEERNQFALTLLDKMSDSSTTITSLRSYIIQNELDFNTDYHGLLKSLFDVVFGSDVQDTKKASALTIIGDAMYKHQFVMDVEVNAFCCVIQVQKALYG